MDEQKTIPENIKKQMTAVLQEYLNLGVIGRAFDEAGVDRSYHLKWVKEFLVYKERFEEVRNKFVDGLEIIAIQRAKEKSDSLLTLMLKAHRPEVYGDKSEIKHTMSNQIQLVFAEGMLSPEEKALLQNKPVDEEE